MHTGWYRKTLVIGTVVLLLLTGLSPFYGGISFNKSKAIECQTDETNSIDFRNQLDRKSFLDGYKLSEIKKNYRDHLHLLPRFKNLKEHLTTSHDILLDAYPRFQKPTVINGESWDMIVPDDYSSIQNAVNAVGPQEGYHIFVRSGIYKENIFIDTDGVTLHGEDRENTVIDGGKDGNVLTLDSSYHNISGFTIQNSGSGNAGIHFNVSSGNQIHDNKIVGNDGCGLWLYRSHGNDIEDNLVVDNDANGLFLNFSSLANTISNNQIIDNDVCGIKLDETSRSNLIAGNQIENNQIGVKCIGNSDGNIIHHNSFMNNIEHNAYDNSSNTWDDDISKGNHWSDYTGSDSDGDGIGDTPYFIHGGDNVDQYPLMSPPSMKSFSIDNISIDQKSSYYSDEMGILSYSSGDTIVVPDDYPTIQEAVNHSHAGDTIRVRAGIYYENVIVDKSLSIIGDSSENTFVDGSGSGHIFKVVTDNVTISGFTIQNTNLGFAGIKIEEKCSTIRNNIICGCGDGIYLSMSKETIIKDNRLTGNHFGIYIDVSSDSKILDNTIEMNEDGVSIWNSKRIYLTNNNFLNNSFNGVQFLLCSHNHLQENNIRGNGNFGIWLFSSKQNDVLNSNIWNNSHDGISMHGSTNNAIINSIGTDNEGSGVSIWFHSDCNQIHSNEIISNWGTGIVISENSNNNLIANNTVICNDLCGILCSLCNNNIITCNTVISNGGQRFGGFVVYDGVALLYSENNIISKNIVSNNSGCGILMGFSCVHNTIIDNTINENGYRFILGGDGIFASYNCNNNLFANNTILNNCMYGIDLSSNCENNKILGNDIKHNGFGILWSLGAGIILSVECSNNSIFWNNLINNFLGVGMGTFSNKNNITNNNFINNLQHASFLNSFNNVWNGNYWNYWQSSIPKPIFGYVLGLIVLNFDWHPAREPYDMGG